MPESHQGLCRRITGQFKIGIDKSIEIILNIMTTVLKKQQALEWKHTHKCKEYCGICSPVHALEVLFHRAIIRQKQVFSRIHKKT